MMQIEDISKAAAQISKTDSKKAAGAGTGKTGSRLPQPSEAAPNSTEKPGKGPKYRNIETTVDGIRFASQKEARRFLYLKGLENSGEISDLRLQVNFTLQEGFTKPTGERVKPIIYKADFTYRKKDENGGYTLYIVEDIKTKGTRTEKYKIKRKLFMEKFRMEITEV